MEKDLESLENKIEKLSRVNGLFDKFVSHIKEIRENVGKQTAYTDGYIACLLDILKNIDEEKESDLLDILKSKQEMKIRKEVLEEVITGVESLYNAYDKISKE